MQYLFKINQVAWNTSSHNKMLKLLCWMCRGHCLLTCLPWWLLRVMVYYCWLFCCTQLAKKQTIDTALKLDLITIRNNHQVGLKYLTKNKIIWSFKKLCETCLTQVQLKCWSRDGCHYLVSAISFKYIAFLAKAISYWWSKFFTCNLFMKTWIRSERLNLDLLKGLYRSHISSIKTLRPMFLMKHAWGTRFTTTVWRLTVWAA